MVSAWKNARGLLTALLIASAALLAIGVTLEKSAESEEAAAVTGEASESGEAGHSEAEEGHFEETEGDSSVSHSESKETLLGIDTDSPLAVGAGVVLSLVLAGLALRSNNRIVLVVVMLFALAFAIVDGKELFHQLDESRTALAMLAGVIAMLHLGAAALAGREAQALPAT